MILFEKLCDIEVAEDVVEYKLDAMISPSNIIKTFVVLEFIKSLTTRKKSFGLKVSSIRNVYSLEGEPDQSRLRRSCKQICHSDEQFNVFVKHFIYIILQLSYIIR